MVSNRFWKNLYLAFRYVANDGIAWSGSFMPEFSKITQQSQTEVSESSHILEALGDITGQNN
jgi:hypothetical protein